MERDENGSVIQTLEGHTHCLGSICDVQSRWQAVSVCVFEQDSKIVWNAEDGRRWQFSSGIGRRDIQGRWQDVSFWVFDSTLELWKAVVWFGCWNGTLQR